MDINRKLSLPLEVIDGVVTRWQDAKVKGLGEAIVKDLYPANILASLIRISSPSDLNQLNVKGFSPLMLAVINGHEQIFKALLEKGVDINLRGSAGESALILAVRWGREQMFRDLINLGADSSGLDPNTAPASMRSEIEGYLKRGPDTQRDPSGKAVGGDPCKLLQQRLE